MLWRAAPNGLHQRRIALQFATLPGNTQVKKKQPSDVVVQAAGSDKDPARRATPTLMTVAHSASLRNAGVSPTSMVRCFGL